MKLLNKVKKIREIDKSGMLDILLDFPRQCEEAVGLAKSFSSPPRTPRPFANIAFTAMGGSAISGDLLKSYLVDRIKIPIIVNRDYRLPAAVGRKTLLFALSYSGNTEETLSSYREAKKRGAKIVAISSGGKLRACARRDKIPHILIPAGFPPRTALGYLFFLPLALLSQYRLVAISREELAETLRLLKTLKRKLSLEVPAKKNLAKEIALRLDDRFPVIYGAEKYLAAVVRRFRAQLAENSKTLSSSHLLPEMNHNEIVGWENPREIIKKSVVVIFRDCEDHPRIKKRAEITRRLIEKEKAAIIEIASRGRSRLARLFYLIYLTDMVSFYLAILKGADPTPVKKIDYLKKRLAEVK